MTITTMSKRPTRQAVRMALALFGLAVVVPSHGCIDFLDRCAGRDMHAGDAIECPMPEWTDRSFALQLPWNWDGTSALPVIFAIHGGGGNRRSAASVTCPDGDVGDPQCFPILARTHGFAVVLPDGTGTRPVHNVRTWNAGGGSKGFNCASGAACASGIDDIRYFRELLAELRQTIPVDDRRIFATGLSNGAAMSHRLACELPEEIAAIVAVGGTNQFAAVGGRCGEPVPVLQIHGTEDPCWSYDQSDGTCIGSEDNGIKLGVNESMEVWRTINGCSTDVIEEAIENRAPSDGTTSVRKTWQGCRAELSLIRIQGGGHTWPNGDEYLDSDRIGRVERDFGSEVVVEFFLDHPKP